MRRHLPALTAFIALTACAVSDGPDDQETLSADLSDEIGTELDDTGGVVFVGAVLSADARLDLGAIDPRCPQTATVTIENTGDQTASGVSVEPPEGWAATLSTTTLAAGQSTTVALRWEAPVDAVWTDTLEVTATDAVAATVVLQSEPAELDEVHDIDLGDRTTADLLLAVDRSCNVDTMFELDPHWPTFRTRLAEAGVTLRMASVVDDSGCIRGEDVVLDDLWSDEDLRAGLWEQQDWSGEWGRYTEKLLALGVLAFEAADGGCNAGLLSDSAPVHFVGFSDEPDQSDAPWETVLAELQDSVGDRMLTVHGIGGPLDGSCPWAQPYTGVADAADATGGRLVDICTADWSEGVTALAEGVLEAQGRVPLPDHIDGSSVHTVTLDGAALHAWDWDAERHALLLSEAALGGASLRVTYTPPAECVD